MIHPISRLKDIRSPKIRAMVEHLMLEGHEARFVDQPWSAIDAMWVYFSIPLEIESHRIKFELSDQFTYHENTDPKSGTERGLIDQETMEGIMGLLN